ncbi:MAG: HEAT repeat domain-containing protein, partial [Tepidisphaeraceae bacterium]
MKRHWLLRPSETIRFGGILLHGLRPGLDSPAPVGLLALMVMAIGSIALAQSRDASHLPYGQDGLDIPKPIERNATSPRTVQLLIEAASRKDELSARRVQLVADIGACKLPEGLPFLRAALNDADPAVRAEAARAAGAIGDPSVAPDLRKKLDDLEADVRREVYLAGGALKDEHIVSHGLRSQDPVLLSAALASAFAREHAAELAPRVPKMSPDLQAQAIVALGRIGVADYASLVAGFLDKSIVLKTAALRALAGMKATGQSVAAQALLNDPHPTVRREALRALAGVATRDDQQRRAM